MRIGPLLPTTLLLLLLLLLPISTTAAAAAAAFVSRRGGARLAFGLTLRCPRRPPPLPAAIAATSMAPTSRRACAARHALSVLTGTCMLLLDPSIHSIPSHRLTL